MELLNEIGDYLDLLAETQNDPTLKLSIKERAADCKNASRQAGESADLTKSRRDGPWVRVPEWLESKADRPWLFERGSQQGQYWRSYSPESTGDLALRKALESACPDCEAQSGEVMRIHFAEPGYLPKVTIAHLTRGRAPVWEAMFSLTQTNNGTHVARSFDFESSEVHRLRAIAPLNCVGHELEYLRFFMYVVRGELGAFRLLEGPVLAEAKPYLERADLWTKIPPLRFRRVAADGRILFGASVLYGGRVFSTELAVAPDGMIEMLNDSPVGGDIIEELAG